ncbi:hypothetical protein BCR44DRAFT_1171517 [Catenaria anguillulae PL171]|uniref:Uncharacterized protein n=1 Tax=Catenaria anguillulae PL171 TaxID=765915 RepID=A0A1Y2I4E6_9FUNG|nr:hypothetical protein BCR44DRAFT_1171517 [Catenaria anguillulae PL171]
MTCSSLVATLTFVLALTAAVLPVSAHFTLTGSREGIAFPSDNRRFWPIAGGGSSGLSSTVCNSHPARRRARSKPGPRSACLSRLATALVTLACARQRSSTATRVQPQVSGLSPTVSTAKTPWMCRSPLQPRAQTASSRSRSSRRTWAQRSLRITILVWMSESRAATVRWITHASDHSHAYKCAPCRPGLRAVVDAVKTMRLLLQRAPRRLLRLLLPRHHRPRHCNRELALASARLAT